MKLAMPGDVEGVVMSREGWKKTTWGDLASLEYGKSLKNYHESTGDVPVFGTNGPIGFTTEPLCKLPSVIIGRKGAYRGVHYSDKPFFVIDTAFYLRPKTNEIDPLFAYYQLLTQDLNSMDSGSAIPSTSRDDFYSMEISLPPLSTQRRITAILSALDEKIELNRQTNTTLQAIAQAIFKEWFVDFRFPGATGEMQDSELGSIPKKWSVGKLGDAFNITMGQSPPGESYNEVGEGIPFFQGRTDFTFRFPTKRVFTTEPKRYAKKFDTLVSVRAPVGDMNIATENCCIGRGLSAVIHTKGCYSFTYYFLKELTAIFKGFEDNGTVFGSINKSEFEAMACITPDEKDVFAFENTCRPIDDIILNNEQQIAMLTAIREALLPTLMSGEIEL
jgi:type I restriction enzyme, S subunit